MRLSRIIQPLCLLALCFFLVTPVRAEDAPFRLSYAPGASALTTEQEKQISEQILSRMKSDEAIRLEIRAFAQPHTKGQSETRRLSLQRALVIRDFLMKGGIDRRRILLYPLGDHTSEEIKDKVEIIAR